MSLSLYKVDELYNQKLRMIDSRVMDLSCSKSSRPFVGILIIINGLNYVAPLSSPKPKHLKMKNSLDFLKIDGGSLGIINFNNMIPVKQEHLIKIDPSKFIPNKISDLNYINLLNKQLSWINKKINEEKIIKKAEKLRTLYISQKLPKNIEERCVNFILLERMVN